jgi:hypothetical protein
MQNFVGQFSSQKTIIGKDIRFGIMTVNNIFQFFRDDISVF